MASAAQRPDPMATPAPAARPPRVLHVVESLDKGAVEGWLVRMLRHANRRGVALDWTFYCTLDAPGALDAEARALGARILRSPVPIARKAAFAAALGRELRSGHYDVLHAHHDLVSSLYLVAALGAPLRRRIVHAHNADESVLTPSRLKGALYRPPMRRICLGLADRVVGISDHTLDTLLAGRARRAPRDVVHYYGVEPLNLRTGPRERAALRRALALPADARILLFAGRLVPEKNPLFAIDVLAQMRRSDPSVFAVFAGAGSLEREVAARAEALGVQDAVRMLGWRRDVPALMSASDWFILPRPEQPMEGFGLAVVEAQLAGLRLLLSRGIPDDPLLPTAQARRLRLGDGPSVWAAAALEMLREPPPQASKAAAALARSPMDMDTALAGLLALHD